MLTTEQIAAIRERCDAATPGRWFWYVNTRLKEIHLENGRYVVMGVDRYGMDSAAPTFRVNGIMKRADALAESIPGKEHHVGFDDYINHPDAIFIENARADMMTLFDILDAANARVEALERALSTSCYACLSHNTQDDWICETCRDAGEYPHLRKTNWRFDAARFAGKDAANA